MANCCTTCPNVKILMPVKEAATLLGLKQRHLYNLLEQQNFPGVKIGGKWLIAHAAIQRVIEKAESPKTV